MFKPAWTVSIAMTLVLPAAAAIAQDRGPVFKDLPGVVPERSRVTSEAEPDEVRCQSGVGFVRNHHGFRNEAFGRDFPTQIYRCESNGFTYTGTDLPPNRPWVPGLNPHFLPDN